jgi:TolB-like protein/Tfp pilus assembly protein PilF
MNPSSWLIKFKERKIGEALAVYLGIAWVLREALIFLVEKYGWAMKISDTITILVIFGLPALLIYLWFNEKFTERAVLYQFINIIIAFSLIGYDFVNPGELKSVPSRLIDSMSSKKQLAESIRSLVVLPFDNYTGDETSEYYVSGMHDALIGDVSKIGALRVPGKTTSRSFKNSEKSIPEIAAELRVDAVIEGSVSCIAGDSVCIQIKLFSAYPEEQQLWVQDYYEEKSKILNLYKQVTKQISEEINIILTPQEESFLAESKTVDPEAYDAFLQGQYNWEKVDQESMQKALEYFELAIEKDPDWADPYAGLANAWAMLGTFFRVFPKSITQPNFYKYMNKALELGPNSAHVHYVKAINAVWSEFDWEKGEKAFLRSLELNPNNALCRMYYAHLLMILSRSGESLVQANLALELDPLKPLILGLYGVVMRNEGEYQSATEHFEKALIIDPNFGFAAGNLADMNMDNAYSSGDYEKWVKLWDKKVGAFGHWNDEGRSAVLNAFYERGHIAAIEEMFKMNEKYGDKCYMSGGIKAERNLKLKKYNNVMDYLEEEYEKRDMSITYIATNLHLYEHLKDNPRFIELLQKMKLQY